MSGDAVVTRTVPALEVHKVGANLIFDGRGLSPYWGVVDAFEPGDDTERQPFDALGLEWAIESTSYWQGKLAHPEDGRDVGGLYEYRYQLVADDAVGDRDATLAFRPGYPDHEHVDTGEPIGSLPVEYPESLRVEVQTTNVDPDDVLALLRAFFDAMGLNPDYVGTPHEWSRLTAFEGYVRVDRDESAFHLTGDGGIIQRLAQFGSSEGNYGVHKWDHEDVQGHYEAVALDRDTWDMVMPRQAHAKRLKSYHPEHVRSEAGNRDDPLYHPKLEVQLWQQHADAVPWGQHGDLLAEFQTAAANALQWGGVGLDADGGAFVADGYHAGGWTDQEVPVVANPLPELEETVATRAEDQLLDPGITHGEFDVVETVADGGTMHYSELAEQAGVSSSTVYRAVKHLGILEADGGTIQFPDGVTRDRVNTLIQRFREAVGGLAENLRDVVDGLGRLVCDSDEPSALERWMDAHGAVLAEHHSGLHFKFPGREFTKYELVQIMRAGYERARQAGLESAFRDGLVTWRDADGNPRGAWDIIPKSYADDRILGSEPLLD